MRKKDNITELDKYRKVAEDKAEEEQENCEVFACNNCEEYLMIFDTDYVVTCATCGNKIMEIDVTLEEEDNNEED